MARPIKNGLDYFPFDVDFFTDEKIRLIGASHGNTGFGVLIKILCRIYRNGYFTEWNPDESKSFAKYDAHIPEKKLIELVEEALKRDFFSEELYKKYSILTSRGIQKRYFSACKKRTHQHVDNRYLLVNPNDFGCSSLINSEIIEVNSEIILQRKEKQIIVNESDSKTSSLAHFYETELLKIVNKEAVVSKMYSDLVCYINGENELQRSLKGLIVFKEQLSFEQFSHLWQNKCAVYTKYQDALMKINENQQYQKGDSLISRLSSWFDNDKFPETLHPVNKPKKILNTNN